MPNQRFWSTVWRPGVWYRGAASSPCCSPDTASASIRRWWRRGPCVLRMRSVWCTNAVDSCKVQCQPARAPVPPGAGSMAALLGMARSDVEALCAEFGGDGVLQPANYNDPGQIVIAGETARVQAAVDAVKARRLGKSIVLKVSAPFHCRMLHPAAERLAHVLAQVSVAPLTIPVLSTVTATPHPSPQTVCDLLVQQVCAPVRWEEAMRYAVAQGCDALLEVGPGKALSGMMKRIAPQVEVLALDEFFAR